MRTLLLTPAGVAALLVVVAGFASLAASGPRLAVSEHKLANGMKILIHEDHDIPNVAMYFFYKVGSRNERPGTTGISHFFEHMMFNGAKKYGPKQFDIVMERHGGANNAYTSRDLTVYTDWFPREALEVIFDLEADRIQNLNFDPKIIESERGVVYNERKMAVDNSNRGTLYEQLNAAAYTAHPYGWPVVGWASDIESWTMEDLEQHFRMGYAPNNCLVVVTGDVTPEEVLKLARKYLEPIPSHDPPPPVRTKEPAQQGERRVEVRRPAQLPHLLVSYHVPETRHPDYYPLEVLGAILAEGRSSRLYRRLVDGGLAISVDYSHDLSLDPGQFVFSVRPRSGVEVAEIEKALYEELDKAGAGGVSARELEKAKNLLLVDLYDEMKTIAGKANLIGRAEIYFGGYREVFQFDRKLAGVTAEDVQRVARRYFHRKNRTVAVLVPEREGGAE